MTEGIPIANRNFLSKFIYSMHAMPVAIDCNIAIGSTGAVGTINGPCVASVTRLAAGIYRVQLQDNYSKLYSVRARVASPVSGSNVNDGSFSVGTAYQITAVGSTNWAAIGLPASLTPAIGQVFVATGVGGAGSGTAKAIGVSGISAVEIMGDPSTMLAPSPAPLLGSFITIQCLGATNSSTTTLIPKDPASGSVLYLEMYLSNSSVTVAGE